MCSQRGDMGGVDGGDNMSNVSISSSAVHPPSPVVGTARGASTHTSATRTDAALVCVLSLVLVMVMSGASAG
jgi:hypothetical protein